MTEIFFRVARWKTSSPNSLVSIKFFLHSKTQNAKFFKTIFCMKIFLLLNDRKSQIPRVKALKYRVFEMEFLSHRQLSQFGYIFFGLHAISTKPSRSHAKSESISICFCHAPTAVETTENMAALNVNYIVGWIITVLGDIDSNHTFNFDLNCFL